MKKITTMMLAAALASSSSLAFAQGAGGAGGSAAGVSSGTAGIGSPVGGAGTTPSTATGLGNGNNPGFGDRSDPSVRLNPGLDANGPCNGARSTSGNNTPSC
jgi:type IV secretory pathway TrbL component